MLAQLQLESKKVLLRLDLDVNLKNGKVEDATRIENSLPTISAILAKKSPIIIIGHLGRPASLSLGGSKGEVDLSLSTKLLVPTFEKLLDKKIVHIEAIFNHKVKETVFSAKEGDIFLLENLRFDPREESNDPSFARDLASLGDVFVNDAFAVCHRKHASVAFLPQLLPSVAGLRLEAEVEKLSKVVKSPARPLVALIGGAKIETKLPVIDHLSKIADHVLVGGKLPIEVRYQKLEEKFAENVLIGNLTSDGGDIDLATIEKFSQVISQAKTVIWNGPMGVYEEEKYMWGTKTIAEAIVKSGATSVIGGGETIAAVNKLGLAKRITWISSGGGAMLEFLAGKKLPGLVALE